MRKIINNQTPRIITSIEKTKVERKLMNQSKEL